MKSMYYVFESALPCMCTNSLNIIIIILTVETSVGGLNNDFGFVFSGLGDIARLGDGSSSYSIEIFGDLLTGFFEDVDQFIGVLPVFSGEEGVRTTFSASSTGSSDSMDVIFKLSGEIVVDDELDIRNIQTSGGKISSDQDIASSGLVKSHDVISLTLSLVTVDGDSVRSFAGELVNETVGTLLCGGEDQNFTNFTSSLDFFKDFSDSVLLHDVVNDFDVLLNTKIDGQIIVTNDDVNRLFFAEFQGKLLDFSRPGSRPHEGLSIGSNLRNYSSDLGLETHIKHTISLIQHQIGDSLEVNHSHLEEVQQSSWGGDDDMVSSLEFSLLSPFIGTTVDHSRVDLCSLAEFLTFVLDLNG